MAHTVAEIAEAVGGSVEGDPGVRITGLADLREAGPSELSFVANARYLRHLAASRAGAMILGAGVECTGPSIIRVDDPYAAFATALRLFHPLAWPAPHIDPRAAIHPEAHLHPLLGANVSRLIEALPAQRILDLFDLRRYFAFVEGGDVGIAGAFVAGLGRIRIHRNRGRRLGSS